MKLAMALMLVLLLFITGCSNGGNVEKVDLKTEDGINIKADYYQGNSANVILLHMLSRSKEDWKDFALKLNENNYNVIAIDMRGHGESQLNFNEFTSDDFNNIVLDIEAARKFLETRNQGKLFIIGASIGANSALDYASDNDVTGIILLSPGENYRGVETFDAMKNYRGPVMIVASEDDLQSIRASQQLYGFSEGDKEIKIYKKAGHGTRMFNAHPELVGILVDWINKHN